MTHRFSPSALAAALLLAGAVVAGCGTTSATQPAATPQKTAKPAATQTEVPKKMKWSSPPAMQIDPSKSYEAVFHTNYGDFTVDLFAKDSPHTVNNFVFLAKNHFYDGDKFFRIIKTFMIQTGDPNNNGTGGPGYKFDDELPPKYPYGPGIVAMANAGANTNGSQFFICTGQDSANLNQMPNYTEFGKIVSGMNIVQDIASIPVTANPIMGGEPSKPTKDAHIMSIDIVEK